MLALLKLLKGFTKFLILTRDTYGIPDPNGKCVLVSIDSIGNFIVTYFQNTIPVQNVTPIEIKGVTVELMAFESVEQTNANRSSLLQKETNNRECQGRI